MAKQIAWLCNPVIGTFGELTGYKLGENYYVRKKSTLTGKRVKTSPEFTRTMVHANLLARASKIGAQVYKALPPGWRQCWMYRSFTGEAFTLLQNNPYNDEAVKQLLWKCYVEPWEQRKIIDPDNSIFQPKPKKIRKPRKYSEESIQRMLKRKDKNGKPKFRDPEEEERKRQHKAMNDACYERTMEKQKQLRAASFGQRALQMEGNASASVRQRPQSPGIKLRNYKPRKILLKSLYKASPQTFIHHKPGKQIISNQSYTRGGVSPPGRAERSGLA
jgi:hypothetical protein